MCIYIAPALALVVLTQRMASCRSREATSKFDRTTIIVQNGCESVSEAAIFT